MIYIIGSLKNPGVQLVAQHLREAFPEEEVFDDWASPGPDADDRWQGYENGRGRTYQQALDGRHAQHVFEFDLENLKAANSVVLVLPAGKSAHLELGWCIGKDKPAYILLPPDFAGRFDVMYCFATAVLSSIDGLIHQLRSEGV